MRLEFQFKVLYLSIYRFDCHGRPIPVYYTAQEDNTYRFTDYC